MQRAPVDAGERQLAAAQLDDIALAHAGKPWGSWKNIVVEWHVQALADTRAESWIPGMSGPQEPAVEQALTRLYSHHMRATIARLKAENTELRRKLIDAAACARFYANGGSDAGLRARAVLGTLVQPESTAAAEGVKQGQRH